MKRKKQNNKHKSNQRWLDFLRLQSLNIRFICSQQCVGKVTSVRTKQKM